MSHTLLCCYSAIPISCIYLNLPDICYEDLHSLRKDTLLDLQLKLVLRTTSSVSVLSCILGGFKAPNPIECLQDEPASTSMTMSLPSRITKRMGADPENFSMKTDPVDDAVVFMIVTQYYGREEFEIDGQGRSAHKFGAIDLIEGPRSED